MENGTPHESLSPHEAPAFDEEAWYRDAAGLAATILDEIGTQRGDSQAEGLTDADWTDDALGKRFDLVCRNRSGRKIYSLKVTDTLDWRKTSRFVFNSHVHGLYKVEHGPEGTQESLADEQNRAWLCQQATQYLMSAPVDFNDWFVKAADRMELDARLHYAAMDKLVRDEIVARPAVETERTVQQSFYVTLEKVKQKYDLSDALARKVFDIAEEQINKERLDGQQA